ncbi:protein YmgL [Escherichia coli]
MGIKVQRLSLWMIR